MGLFGARSLAGALVAALSATAVAQDYTVSGVTGRYQAPPANAVQITIVNAQTRSVTLPFTFPFYGSGYSSVWVCSEGFIQFGVTSGSTSGANSVFPHGTGSLDGQVCPYWDDLNMSGATARCWQWTNGQSPNRTFVVGWENVPLAANAAARLSFQVQLSEDTGRIVFAYKPDTTPSVWPNSSYTPAIDAFNETRYVTPPGMNITSNSAHPPSDWQFDPAVRTFTGTLLYEQVVADASGLGNSVQQNVPLANVRVELRKTSGGSLCGAGTTAADGSFSVAGVALRSTDTGGLSAVASNAACVVRPSGGGATATQSFGGTYSFASDTSVGTQTLTAASDPSESFLPQMHVARVLGSAHVTLSARTTKPITQLEVLYNRNSSAPTSYTRPVAPTAAQMRVGSALSGNHDGWDTDVILRTWGAHVLGCVSAFPQSPYVQGFDVASSPENAFSEGFGYALLCALAGKEMHLDATSSSTATVLDLESPILSSPRGGDVAAWVAAGLSDLVDPADEGHDAVDGTAAGATYAFFDVAASMNAAPTGDTYLTAWNAAGKSGAGFARGFIWHGIVPDDAYELNGAVEESAPLGTVGFRKDALVLTLGDEDWFETTLDAATTSLGVDLEVDRVKYPGVIAVEIRDAAGALLATGTDPGGFEPVVAGTGPAPAGTYRISVRRASGGTVGAYALQVYAAVQVLLPRDEAWTVGQAYLKSVTVIGGVPPYTLLVQSPFAPPPGLSILGAANKVGGNPTTAGRYDFFLTARDSGSPRHEGSTLQTFTVNAPFALSFGRYTGLALGKAVDVPLGASGGTAPFVFDVTGDAPTGTTLDALDLRVRGTPSAAGVWTVDVDAGEAAGAAASGSARIVVCGALQSGAARMALAADAVACGFWFDALQGATATISATTEKGGAKRVLSAFVFGPDGAAVETGKFVGGTGKAKSTGLRCPTTGRYFAVFEAGAGPATTLVGTVKVTPPKSGAGAVPVFKVGDFLEVRVGALAGAVLTFKETPDKGSKAMLQVAAIIGPDGNPMPLSGLVKEKGGGFTLTATLPLSGTWIVRVSAKSGGAGAHKWSYSLKQPKGVVYSAD